MFFPGTEATLAFLFFFPLSLFSLSLLLHSMLFLFSLAFFSLCLSKQTFGLLFLLGPLTLADVLRGVSRWLLLLSLVDSALDWHLLKLTSTRLLVLVMPFFGLLLFAFLRPTLGWPHNSRGLFGPVFFHHVPHRDL